MGTNLGYLVLIISNLITTNYQYSVVGFFMLRIVKVYERSRKLVERQGYKRDRENK